MPKKRAALGALLEEDPEILTELEKARQRTLIFQNCHLDSELALVSFFIEKGLIQKGDRCSIRSQQRVGKKIDDRTQLLKVEFETAAQAEVIFQKKRQLGERIFVHWDATKEAREADRLARQFQRPKWQQQRKPHQRPTRRV